MLFRSNLAIAIEYEKLGQTASAVGFYLRAAEYGFDTHPLVAYGALLRISICIEGQKDRNLTVSNVILQAMAYLPERPEAYFLMSKFHEKFSQWQESYTFAELGLVLSDRRMSPLPIDVTYVGKYGLEFQKAVSSWWIGRRDETARLFIDLVGRQEVSEDYKNAITANMERIGLTRVDV